MVGLIEAEVHRIDQIVRSLLDLGRPARGRPTPVDVAATVESCLKLLGKGPELSQVTLRQEIEANLFVLAESGPLAQVLINLVLNAAQAMAGQGAMTIRARRVGSGAVLEVADSGPGLPPEVKAHLFEPFFTTKSAGKGTGLGLVVSQHLVLSMGGKLSADNAPEGGAVFSLELPVP